MRQLPLILILGLAIVSSAFAKPKDDLKAFPKAEEGYERYVFRLPKLEDEHAAKVSLVVGKTMKVDPVNRHGLSGKIEAVSIQGWGYTYYKVESKGQMFGTMMAPPEGVPKVDKFVQIRDNLGLIRYNSKLPVVVVVPKGFEVRYRVWMAGEEQPAGQE